MHPQHLGVRAPFPASPRTRAAHLAATERQAARSAQSHRQKHLPLHESSESGAGFECLPPPGAARCQARLRRPHSPGSAGALGPGRPRWTARRRAKRRPRSPQRSRSLGGRTAAARPERRSQPRVAALPVASNGPERRPRCQRGPGPRVTHRLKCSMIFSSRTFSGKFPTQRCLVSRTMLGGVPATAVAGSPSPASYAAVSAGRRAPGRRRRRLRRWRRQRRRLLRLPPVQRPSLSPRF